MLFLPDSLIHMQVGRILYASGKNISMDFYDDLKSISKKSKVL